MKEYAVARELHPEDVRRIRELLGMTQKEFAAFAGCSKRAVESWEEKNTPVSGPVVTLLDLLWRQPALALQMSLPEKKGNLRVWYMYRDMVCSVIDVDDRHRHIEVKNYIGDPLYCAFGSKLTPDYDDYLAFLESRCFPRTRDKMKLQLRELGLPFYDPIMIIRKTDGRMAEDEFWLRMEQNND